MKSKSCYEMRSIICISIMFFLLFTTVFSTTNFKDFKQNRRAFSSSIKQKKTQLVKAHLKKINKPFVKSIKSPDGDIIDCVLIHLQPAFDLPQLKGTLPLDPPKLPRGHDNGAIGSEVKQLWNSNGESCPNGTIPIRRTSESDLVRFSNMAKKMGTKSQTDDPGHEHAVGYVIGEYYGGQGLLNVWAPNVTNKNDFSLSQIWVITEIPNHETNTVEAGWMAYQLLNGDNLPRLFAFWTNNGYRDHYGCYNLICSGFVQISDKLSLGATITPISTYNGDQYDYSVLIWKDPGEGGNWWLRFGNIIMGYWPASLFPDLRDHATAVEFGGEVYSSQTSGHTSSQMGSGQFPTEGFKRAAFVRNMQLVNGENTFMPMSDLSIYAEKPNCYDVTKGYSDSWGNFIYFGGPGKNPNCP